MPTHASAERSSVGRMRPTGGWGGTHADSRPIGAGPTTIGVSVWLAGVGPVPALHLTAPPMLA
jgi:hypothetical protein